MPWSDDEWAMFVAVLKEGFAARDPFTDDAAAVYRLLLDDIEPEAAIRAIKEAVLEGQALRPRPGEIVVRVRQDPTVPTFDEAYRLIFGRRGVLTARPQRPVFASESDRQWACDKAAEERAAEMHPLVHSFVVRQGIRRLRHLPVEDPDHGELRRRDLREAWHAHVRTFTGREVAALAAGGDVREGLQRLDPLAALGVRPDRPQISKAQEVEQQ